VDLAHIVFTGLCSFAAANADNDHLPMAAIFPSDPGNNHHVYLLVDDRYRLKILYDDTNPKRHVKIATSEMGRVYQYIMLDEESIHVENMATNALLVHPDAATYGDVPNGKDVDTMHWVPHMDMVWMRWIWRHKAAPPVLTGTPHESPRHVEARMELIGGVLAPSYVSNEVWRFTPRFPHRTFQQAIAQEVTLDVPLKTLAAPLVLTTTGLDCPTSGKTIAQFQITWIKQPPKGADDPITVLLANVMPEDLIPGGYQDCGTDYRGCPMKDKDPCPATCVDRHFAVYYDSLYKQHQNFPVLPRRVAVGPPSQIFALRVGATNCGGNNYP
jgi:hypothetical protein